MRPHSNPSKESAEQEFEHGPGIDEAPLNDLDDGEAGLDPNILDGDLLDDASMDLG